MRKEALVTSGLVVLCLSSAPLAAQDLDAPRPIAGTNTVFIEEMTWMDVRDAIAPHSTRPATQRSSGQRWPTSFCASLRSSPERRDQPRELPRG